MIEESHIAYYDGQTDVASASADPAEAEAQLELAAAEPSADQAVAQAVGEGGGAEGGGEPEAEIAAAVIPEEAGDSVYYHAENVGCDGALTATIATIYHIVARGVRDREVVR